MQVSSKNEFVVKRSWDFRLEVSKPVLTSKNTGFYVEKRGIIDVSKYIFC